eukprot:12085576-Alexandrium_andersonii.AAC.1
MLVAPTAPRPPLRSAEPRRALRHLRPHLGCVQGRHPPGVPRTLSAPAPGQAQRRPHEGGLPRTHACLRRARGSYP